MTDVKVETVTFWTLWNLCCCWSVFEAMSILWSLEFLRFLGILTWWALLLQREMTQLTVICRWQARPIGLGWIIDWLTGNQTRMRKSVFDGSETLIECFKEPVPLVSRHSSLFFFFLLAPTHAHRHTAPCSNVLPEEASELWCKVTRLGQRLDFDNCMARYVKSLASVLRNIGKCLLFVRKFRPAWLMQGNKVQRISLHSLNTAAFHAD